MIASSHPRPRLGIAFLLALCLFAPVLASGQTKSTQAPIPGQLLLVVPFDNKSPAQGLDWIGEAFSEVLSQDMSGDILSAIDRDDRLYAFDRLGLPAAARLSHATNYRLAEQMDVDYLVLGTYNYDGNIFSARAQLLDVKRAHLLPAAAEAGPLTDLINIQRSLAWDLLREANIPALPDKNSFVQSRPTVRLDALENYIRGLMATSPAEKIRRFKEAVRLAPDYAIAQLQLGKTYFAQRDYTDAVATLANVPSNSEQALEANFYMGLAAYYSGNYDKAEQGFQSVATRLPLTEVLNDLGVVLARRGKPATDYFQKAAQADPQDADYAFNLAVSELRSGNSADAVKQLRTALTLKPNDAEAKALLDRASAGSTNSKLPLERIKRNYDEAAFRQLSLEMRNAEEQRMANADPKTHAAYHVDRGREMLRRGVIAQALAEFEEAAQLDPHNADAHSGFAAAAALSGDAATAKREADAANAIKPSAEAYIALARAALKQQNPQQAQEFAGKARQLDLANPELTALDQQIAQAIASPAPKQEAPKP